MVLPDVLHSIRSLLCTATNVTPHERLFSYNRKSASGTSIPSWLTPGRVYLRNHTRSSKHEPIVEEAELIDVNPQYAHVKLNSGHETTVSLRDIAPCHRRLAGDTERNSNDPLNSKHNTQANNNVDDQPNGMYPELPSTPIQTQPHYADHQPNGVSSELSSTPIQPAVDNENLSVEHGVRRSTRLRKERELFADSEHSTI